MFRTLVSSIIRWHVTLFFVIIFMLNMIRIIHHAQHHHHSLHHLASFTNPLASSEARNLSTTIYNIVTSIYYNIVIDDIFTI